MATCVLCKTNDPTKGKLIELPSKALTYCHIQCAINNFAFDQTFLLFFQSKNSIKEVKFIQNSTELIITKSEYIAFMYELLTHFLPAGLTSKSTRMINKNFFPLLIEKTGIFKGKQLEEIQETKSNNSNDIKATLNSKINQNNRDNIQKEKIKINAEKIPKIRNKKSYVDMKPEDKVIGQQEAKSLMLRLIHRFDRNKESYMDLIQNALFYGPTGTGKTLLLRTMCSRLGVNFYELDAAQMTQTGYVGMSISEALTSFIKSDGIEAVENSIIYIDEIDKLASKSSFSSDVGTIAVQNELLKLLEGGEYQLQSRDQHGSSNNLILKTNNIMFIASGSFAEIKSIVKRRLTVEHSNRLKNYSSIACDLSVAEIYNEISEMDFIQFGLKDEFLGRFQQKVPFYPLTKKEQCQVIKLNNSVIHEYKELFRSLDIHLTFDEGAIESLVEKNNYTETGCRGLQRHIREALDVPYGLILESDINATDLIFKANGNYIFLKNT